MNLSTMASPANTSDVHGFTFLGHDINGWIVAMVCALVAAVIYEVTMTLARKVTRRIPYLLLRIARFRLRLDEKDRADAYDSWDAELHHILMVQKGMRLWRFLKGMTYAAHLALVGARATMKAQAEINAKAAETAKLANSANAEDNEKKLASERSRDEKQAARLRMSVAALAMVALAAVVVVWAITVGNDGLEEALSVAITFVTMVLTTMRRWGALGSSFGGNRDK
ncbi:hypothetical protein [Streptomyces sp. NPDC055210]